LALQPTISLGLLVELQFFFTFGTRQRSVVKASLGLSYVQDKQPPKHLVKNAGV
jgi:hypothetical protein